MPSIREQIRTYIDGCSEPPRARDIVKALSGLGITCKHGTIAAMVNEGALTVTGQPGRYRYSVGRRPAPRSESGSERRRQYEIARNERKRAARAAAGVAVRGPRKQPSVRRLNYVAPQEFTDGETVEEFAARGGRVEVLPGIQKSSVYAQRRPLMSVNRRNAW
jgi:hypothetical protein